MKYKTTSENIKKINNEMDLLINYVKKYCNATSNSKNEYANTKLKVILNRLNSIKDEQKHVLNVLENSLQLIER